ncbi:MULTISPECIES: hypothetical protein [unclassified Bradyrhizobium]|uniref:hypothetical protein n=1 Tax=unclassified Bradyrhizobium TaxID=2631580 RepID=UPI0028EFC18F|nr:MULTISPECIES: hypothetical protein [unclassified Bradyrhizobium]
MPAAPSQLTNQTVNTQLTTDCSAQAAATFDINESTWITFFVNPAIPCWMALVSVGEFQVTLSEDISVANVVLRKGLTVAMNTMGSYYTVTMTGTIVDSGKESSFPGAVLGSFTRAAAMKRAVQMLQMQGSR